ncbi:MAG: MFS transporter, partial [Motiliproteus sp.]
INALSAARLFLFGARDVWFVVALPVFLSVELHWQHSQIGAFLALWIVAYGLVQTLAPILTGMRSGRLPDGSSAWRWALLLAFIPTLIALLLSDGLPAASIFVSTDHTEIMLIAGLLIFGVLFAINSCLHSYLIVSYAKEDGVSLDVGFYYMANAMGRLIGTLLSGWLFQNYGLEACLYTSTLFILLAALFSLALPKHPDISDNY